MRYTRGMPNQNQGAEAAGGGLDKVALMRQRLAQAEADLAARKAEREHARTGGITHEDLLEKQIVDLRAAIESAGG